MKKIISISVSLIIIVFYSTLSIASAATATPDEAKGKIHITFAQNEYIDVDYFKDSALKDKITGKECFVNYGDTIYSSNVELNNPKSDKYTFSHFQIWQFDKKGNKTKVLKELDGTSLELHINDSFKGTEFSIVPIGKYLPRKLSLNAYFINNNGKKQYMDNGVWTVNGSTYNEEKGVSPVSSYTVKYNYEKYKDDYYFSTSIPEPYYNNVSENEVVFKESTSELFVNEFNVEMHRYITMTIVDEVRWPIDFWSDHAIKEVRINGKEIKPKDDKIKKIKCGDKIVIRTDKTHRIESDKLNKTSDIPVELENGYEYGFVVPENLKSSEIKLQLKKRNSNIDGTFQGVETDNANVKVIYNNKELLEGRELPGDDDEVTLKIKPFAGYYLDGAEYNGKEYSVKLKYSEINNYLNEHKVKKFYTITLNKKDAYGKSIYKIDGKNVNGTINVKQNQRVDLEYTITDDNYKISRAWFDIIGNVFSEKSGTSSIEIDKRYNNKTISRENFFKIERK